MQELNAPKRETCGPLTELAQLAGMAAVFFAVFLLAPYARDWAEPVRAFLAELDPTAKAMGLTAFIFAVLALSPISRLLRGSGRNGDPT
jgi:hypothetical protein